MRFFYAAFFYLILPLVLLRLLWRSFAAPGYSKRLNERFGFVNTLSSATFLSSQKTIWIHTVSVGEFLGALPLIRELQKNPTHKLVITTTTVTGSERVISTLGDLLGKSVQHFYAPYDLPGSVSRFIKRIKPALLIIMETELWPNTLAACQKNKIPSLLINARLSEKSARGYARFSWLTKPMLQSLSMVLIQQKKDAQRFIDLGLPEEQAFISGNIKFDISLTQNLQEKTEVLRQEWDINNSRLVIIAASTHQGEDEIVLHAFKKVREHESPYCQSARLILVPRHPERFDSIAQLCRQTPFSTVRRSQNDSFTAADILLGDTMGELMVLFGVSHLAFVGGSLVPRGGHNFIEPAAWSLPLQSGEHLFNFSEVSQLMLDADALTIVKTADELATEWISLLSDEVLREKRGNAAYRVVENNRGALEKTLNVIEQFLQY